MPRIELGEVGIRGLNSDTPAQKLNLDTFADGINLRPFDGALQGVFDFTKDGISDNIGAPGNNRDIYAMSQWTPTGSTNLNVVYIFDSSGDDGMDLSFQVINNVTDPGASQISGASFGPTPFIDENERFGIDLFPFNDIIVFNDGTETPREIRQVTQADIDAGLTATVGAYAAFPLPGWISGLTAQKLVTYNNRIIALNGDGLSLIHI